MLTWVCSCNGDLGSKLGNSCLTGFQCWDTKKQTVIHCITWCMQVKRHCMCAGQVGPLWTPLLRNYTQEEEKVDVYPKTYNSIALVSSGVVLREKYTNISADLYISYWSYVRTWVYEEQKHNILPLLFYLLYVHLLGCSQKFCVLFSVNAVVSLGS